MNNQTLENQESLEKFKEKRNLNDVPDLLLSYTYFLNANHSSHISVGYDNQNFTMKIIIYKNNVYEELGWENWFVLFLNKETIQNHFEDLYGVDFVELPKVNGLNTLKLSFRNNEKCLIIIQNKKKIVLFKNEWWKLYGLSSFFHSIVYWYLNNWSQIETFYYRYLNKCIEKNTFKLQSHEFFVGDETLTSFNVSRLFYELPVISRKKLLDDIYSFNVNNLCNNIIE